MQSTDTGDYFPEGYDPNQVEFTEGMGGSSAMLGGGDRGPALPGMVRISFFSTCTKIHELRTLFFDTETNWIPFLYRKTWAQMR